GLDGSAARVLAGVADPENDFDAINKRTLDQTKQDIGHNTTEIQRLNDQVSGFDGRITDNSQSIRQLNDEISDFDTQITTHASEIKALDERVAKNTQEVLWLKKYHQSPPREGTDWISKDEKTGAITIARTQESERIDFSGIRSGLRNGEVSARILTGIAAGAINKDSREAINGSQFFTLQQRVNGLDKRATDIEHKLDALNDTPPVRDVPDHRNNTPDHIHDDAIAHENIRQKPSVAPGSEGFAAGEGAWTTGKNGTALGANTRASGDHSVALGDGSVAERSQTVSVGSEGHERQITHVKAATKDTDAVNLKQLNEGLSHTVEQAQQYTDERFATVQNAMNHVQAELNQIGKAAYAGIAAAMAMPDLTPSGPGHTIVAAGAGSYKSGRALAVGLAYRSYNAHWLINSAISVTSSGDTGLRAHIGYEF
ncbi:YadA family autotransporter adhesin, partial [Candidatus Glomeribacter gigasporarum]